MAALSFSWASCLPPVYKSLDGSSRDDSVSAKLQQMTMRAVVMALLLPAVMRAGSDCWSSCGLTNISITVESEECGSCISIDTTACAGFCWTQDRVYRSPVMQYYQNTCNIREWTYEILELKGCPAGAVAFFTYPVALSCECSKCNSDAADCGHLSLQTSSCSSPALY